MDPFVGEIRTFGFGFTPIGWLPCNGQLLSIRTYTALYSLLGTLYGGDGVSTFGVPNLNGNIAVAPGQLPGGNNYPLGQTGGVQNVTLAENQLPAHTHTLPANSSVGGQATPGPSMYLSTTGGRGSGAPFYVPSVQGSAVNMAASAQAGGSGSHNNMAPYVAMNYCIAVQGIFPTRP